MSLIASCTVLVPQHHHCHSLQHQQNLIQMAIGLFRHLVLTPPTPSYVLVDYQRVALLPTIVSLHGCGLSPADPTSGTFPHQLLYNDSTTFHNPMDFIDKLYAY